MPIASNAMFVWLHVIQDSALVVNSVMRARRRVIQINVLFVRIVMPVNCVLLPNAPRVSCAMFVKHALLVSARRVKTA